MSVTVAQKILELTKAGATVLIDRYPKFTEGLETGTHAETVLRRVIEELAGTESFFNSHRGTGYRKKLGKGTVLYGPYEKPDLSTVGIGKDFVALDETGLPAKGIAWNHRSLNKINTAALNDNPDVPDLQSLAVTDLYFVSNQSDTAQNLQLTLRQGSRIPLLYDAVQGSLLPVSSWHSDAAKTQLKVQLPAEGSVFVLLKDGRLSNIAQKGELLLKEDRLLTLGIDNPWKVQFDPKRGGPVQPVTMPLLKDWRTCTADSVRDYSGVASYRLDFSWNAKDIAYQLKATSQFWLALGEVRDIASVRLNGIDCGVAWTAPYRINITRALRPGENHLEVQVANTWANRIIADQKLPASKRQTWTTAPFNLEGHGRLPAGLSGPVELILSNVSPSDVRSINSHKNSNQYKK